ncbi:MAG: hypothetical protein ABH862_01940 [Candidatus Omnitrophota bacterium]
MAGLVKKYIPVALFLWAQLFTQYCGAEDLELFIALRSRYDGIEDKMSYTAPPGNKINVYQRPLPFYVVVENISNSSQKLWDSGQRNGRSYFSIEVENSRGQKTKINKKETKAMTSLRTYEMIRPGEQRVKNILIDPDSWEGFQRAEGMTDDKFKVRVIYKNEEKTIYSPWYEVTVGRPGSSLLAKTSDKDQRKPGVLSSKGKYE